MTNRKRVNKTAEQHEQEIRALLEAIPDLVFRLSKDGVFLGFVPAKGQETAVPPAGFLGKNVREVLPREIALQTIHHMERVLRTGDTQTFEYRLPVPLPDGDLRDYEARLVVSGQDEVLVIARDITERKRAEEALRESEERLREVLEVSREYVYKHNLETGKYDYISPAALQITGFTPEEIIAMGFEEAQSRTHPEDLERHRTHLENLLSQTAEPAMSPTIQYRWKCKDGQCRWFSDNRAVIRDDNGRPIARVGTIRDITERKRAEEAVREYEQRSREVLEASRDIVYKLNVEARKFEYVSPAVQPLTGFTPQELVGMGFDEVTARIHPQDQPEFRTRAEELPACLGEARAGSAIEYRWQRKDGKYRWLSNSWVLLRDDNGQPTAIVGTVRDITNRKRTEEALQRAREELETRVEARMDGGNTYGLTFRELTVLHLVATGNADKEIAVRLGIRPRTVNKHLENILHKMGADCRTEAGVRALKEGLLG